MNPKSQLASADDPATVFDFLLNLPDYRIFTRALQDATGFSLVLVPAGPGGAPLHDLARRDTGLCRELQQLPVVRVPCGNCWRQVVRRAVNSGRMQFVRCPAGVVDLALPVFNGEQHVGTLLAGKVFHHKRRLQDFRTLLALSQKCRPDDVRRLLTAYRAVPVVPGRRFRAACDLLKLFAQTLEARARSWHATAAAELPLSVKKAKAILRARATTPLTLKEVAQGAGVSVQHFCAVFKRHTGLTFRQKLTRLRVEHAKTLLRNQRLRISEVAFASGFESITSFNRAFKKLTRLPPTEYRKSAPVAD
jgi:AraC-like DNA-binding protein